MLIRPKKRYVRTTDSNHHYRKWSNLIKEMEINRSEQVWVSDITYIRTKNGFLYLSLITDAYSRKVMGYHLSHRLEAKGTVAALRMAINQREYPDQPLIHHSDRGIQYCCTNYVEALQKEGIEISMAEKGNPYENAIAERINRTFKEQLGMGETFESYQLAIAKLIRAVETYNYRRPHTSCDNMTPEKAHKCTGPLKKHWKKRQYKVANGGGADALHTSSQV
jgi:transposase InsO family protein